MYDIQKLRQRQLELCFTNIELAKKAKMPESTLRSMYKKNSAHPHTIRAVARALKIEVKDIVLPNSKKRTA